MKKSIFKLMAIIAVISIIGVSCTEDDITNPTITLTGNATMYVQLGDDFTDPGATANDDKDGDLTTQISVTGTVNTDQVGMYELTYSVSDEAGNTKSEVRTVYVEADGLAGSYAVSATVTGPGAGTYNYTETITASSTDYNKLIISNFSGFSNLTVSAIVSGSSINVNQAVVYDFDGDSNPDNATLVSLGSSYTVDASGATPVAKILTINYQIDYGSGNIDSVTATYTKQ
ncbi:MAG: DUF5011 domain-containing protein [Bacteroidales bacterium]|nr:DUF5011 domain-containing protein [Bacteroidales bacterium]